MLYRVKSFDLFLVGGLLKIDCIFLKERGLDQSLTEIVVAIELIGELWLNETAPHRAHGPMSELTTPALIDLAGFELSEVLTVYVKVKREGMLMLVGILLHESLRRFVPSFLQRRDRNLRF